MLCHSCIQLNWGGRSKTAGNSKQTLFFRFSASVMESEAGHLERPHPGTPDPTKCCGSISVKTRFIKQILHLTSIQSKYVIIYVRQHICDHTYANKKI